MKVTNDMRNGVSLKKEIERAINAHSRESASDTPDFILAKYLIGCLEAFEEATLLRDENTSYRGETVSFSCGWNTATDRCLRLECKNNGPCSGFKG